MGLLRITTLFLKLLGSKGSGTISAEFNHHGKLLELRNET